MDDVMAEALRWQREGQRVALASVVTVVGSAPRGVGAVLLVGEAGQLAGSVSNGCVEPAVIVEAERALRTGAPRLLTYGISEAQNAERIGLSCGGEIRVFVERPDPDELAAIAAAGDAREPLARVVVIAGGQPEWVGRSLVIGPDDMPRGSLGAPTLDTLAAEAARAQLRREEGATRTLRLGDHELEAFIAVYPAPRQLIIVGAGHIAIPLSQLAKVLGYAVIVVDPRAAFNTRERLPGAEALLLEWPDEALAHLSITSATAIAVLTHDNKFDVPALTAALASDASYIGAIGSRGTISERNALLRAAGVSDAGLARIHAPIGLDIGARRPEEIALAILAQIVATRRRPPEE